MSEQTNRFKEIYDEGKDYLKLQLEYGKLTIIEKLTILLSSLAIGLIALFLGVIAIFFLSMSVIDVMASSIGHIWSCLIMCACYILLIAIIVMLRKPLIINPMARLISRIILK